jgi:cytochrome c-type protein NapC
MDFATGIVASLLVVTIALIWLVMLRPGLTAARGGKVLAFVAFFVLPGAALWGGYQLHMEHSKSTKFCLSCHVMEPYGKSLLVDDASYVPAAHYQNRRIDRDHACFTCHTNYTLFGDYKAKIGGLRHLWVNYVGTMPAKIALYQPYRNRECLHCHGGARNFLEAHGEDVPSLVSNETSCIDCHDQFHAVDKVATLPAWKGARLP